MRLVPRGAIGCRAGILRARHGPRGRRRFERREQQLCLLLTARGKAVATKEDGRTHYPLDPEIHEYLLDSVASQGFRLKASAPRPA